MQIFLTFCSTQRTIVKFASRILLPISELHCALMDKIEYKYPMNLRKYFLNGQLWAGFLQNFKFLTLFGPAFCPLRNSSTASSQSSFSTTCRSKNSDKIPSRIANLTASWKKEISGNPRNSNRKLKWRKYAKKRWVKRRANVKEWKMRKSSENFHWKIVKYQLNPLIKRITIFKRFLKSLLKPSYFVMYNVK